LWRFFVGPVIFLGLGLPVQASAQSLLQNTGGSLQQQTGRAQDTNNSQSKTGSPQSSGNQSILSESNALQPLGVVSDPKQSTPEAVVPPSTDLSTSNGEVNSTGGLTYLMFLVGFLGIFLIASFVAYRFSKPNFTESISVDEIIDRDQLAATLRNQQPARKKKPKKKRRKPHQR
jgi:hypothetical protein